MGPRRPPRTPLRRCCSPPRTCTRSATARSRPGPSITGSIQPERRADLRAEVPGGGAAGAQGERRHRAARATCWCASTTPRSATRSVRGSGPRAADQASTRPQRQFERMKTLRGSGMTSAQALDDAEVRRNTAQSDVEAAKARVVAGAPAAAAHRGARAVRRRRQRAQGLGGRHRRDRQGAAQGDRPDQHALRGHGVGRPHGRRAGRADGAVPRERLRRRGLHRQGAPRESRRPTRPRARSRCSSTSRASKQPQARGPVRRRPHRDRDAREPHDSRRARWCATATRPPPGA